MKNNYPNRRGLRHYRTLSVVLILVATASAFACQVPVFRYALERWPADRYELLIMHKGQLDNSDRLRVDRLKEFNRESAGQANFEIRIVDMTQVGSGGADDNLSALWKEHGQTGGPLMVALYPHNSREVPDRIVSVVPFTDAAVAHLIDSPVRQKIASELLDGESAVWIFVTSGQAEKDAQALATLTQQIKLHESQLALPPQEEIEADEFFKSDTKIELRLGFTVVTLDRSDVKEQWLLKMLLGSESDLESLDEPMAFPVLGRGRVLYALVGKGIMPETIEMASRFVIGPCSCQVKEQNPGFDLLMAVDWDTKIGGSTISQPPPAYAP